jgi:hypothetical protein
MTWHAPLSLQRRVREWSPVYGNAGLLNMFHVNSEALRICGEEKCNPPPNRSIEE